MSELTVLQAMAENHAWANHRLYKACLALTDLESKLARTSFFPSIHETLGHNLLVDLYYLDALQGTVVGRAALMKMEAPATIRGLADAQSECDKRVLAHLASMDAAAVDAVIGVERRTGIDRERAGDVILHMLTHAIHHRGQVHAMLSGTRVAPPQLDEYFLANDRQLRADELRELGIRERHQ